MHSNLFKEVNLNLMSPHLDFVPSPTNFLGWVVSFQHGGYTLSLQVHTLEYEHKGASGHVKCVNESQRNLKIKQEDG